MRLPYDILYNIFFMIDDYPTLLRFFILNKTFYNDYIKKYSKTYKHKFNILFKDVFSLLSLLPNLKSNDDIQNFICIQNMCIEPSLKKNILHDILFVYKLYKSAILEESIKKLGTNLSLDLTNIILIQGPEHINNNSKVICNKNKIKLIIPDENKMLDLNIAMNFLYLRQQFALIDNTFF
jgi:hypothetical protein